VFRPTDTLDDIIPEVRPQFEELFERARGMGLEAWIGPAGAGRTCGQQNSLSPQATGASGCQSWHVLGRAVDLQLKPWSYAAYLELGEWWEAQGGFWGGRWLQFGPMGDSAHFHWPEEGHPPGSPSGCPAGGQSACEAYRDAYLAQASEYSATPSPWLAVGAGLAVAAGVVWWRSR
jgi:hypothetical protein